MIRRPARLLLLGVALFFLLLIFGRAAVELYTDALWYGGVGYADVFWTRLGVGAGVQLAAAAIAGALVFLNLWIVGRRLGPIRVRRRYGNLEIAEQVPRGYLVGGALLVSGLAGWWLAALKFGRGQALGVIAWLRRVDWGVPDPVFANDLSFYVFSLPIYSRIVDFFLLSALWATALVVLGYVLIGSIRLRDNRLEIDEKPRLHFIGLVAGVVLLLAARYWLGRYGLLLDGNGIGGGIGYADVNARLPAHRAMATLSVMSVGALLYGAWRRSWTPPIVSMVALAVAAVALGHIYPSVVQRFQVEPNQLAREARYIAWNMEYTRQAYGLNGLERQTFPYERRALPRWDAFEPAVASLPLWDPEPLNSRWNETQTLFGYYHFPQVASDRYGPPGEARQVAIAVREFRPDGLPDAARTWQSLRLNADYIRGMGVEVAPVSLNSPQPVRWIGDLDPVRRDPGAPPDLFLDEPSVYFGQSMRGYVLLVPGRQGALLGTAGRDYPAGVPLTSLGRVLAFGWRFADVNLIFSGEIDRDSRIVFRRALDERLRELAPFVLWDREPYPVLREGRVVWIVDGYTVSGSFPLARAMQLDGAARTRYLRNSVKATVDGVTGEVNLYAVDGSDPILETHRRIYPSLIQPLEAMPPGLRSHLRYPALYLRAQASILTEYHLERPESFYAGQDFWQLPGQNARRAYVPTYALKRLPGENRPEFVLTMPFIARGRQNMTALLIARSDSPRYGELLLLEMPRDQQVPGPGQVEALIEQDPVIAPQFALWRQVGSDVRLGHLRIVPSDSALVYVRPVFLSAQATAIPELRRILVSDGREVVMASTLGEAFRGLRGAVLDGRAPDPETAVQEPLPAMPELADWPLRALELLDQADRSLRAGDWAGFGRAWTELREFLGGVAGDVP